MMHPKKKHPLLKFKATKKLPSSNYLEFGSFSFTQHIFLLFRFFHSAFVHHHPL
jgi:hypothetical protein